MPDFQVEIRLRLNASSRHDAEVWASRALDAPPFENNPDIGYLDFYVMQVAEQEGN